MVQISATRPTTTATLASLRPPIPRERGQDDKKTRYCNWDRPRTVRRCLFQRGTRTSGSGPRGW